MDWTYRARVVFPLLVAVALSAGCSGGEPSGDGLPPGVSEGSPTIAPATGSATASPPATSGAGECPNEAEVADVSRQVGPSVTGDVDGDGTLDSVFLATDGTGPPGCAAFVVAELAAGATIAAPAWEIGPEGGLPQPRLHSMVDLNGVPGVEVLVDEAAGASTQFVGAYVYSGGDLVKVDVSGTGATDEGSGDLFPYGGSVGHLEAADCAPDGRLVVSTATPSSNGADAAEGIYVVQRRFFVFDDAALDLDETVRTKLPIDDLTRLPEFGAGPFGSC